MLVKAAVNFLHGGLMRLMKRDAGKGNRSLDVSGIINEVGSMFAMSNTLSPQLFSYPSCQKRAQAN